MATKDPALFGAVFLTAAVVGATTLLRPAAPPAARNTVRPGGGAAPRALSVRYQEVPGLVDALPGDDGTLALLLRRDGRYLFVPAAPPGGGDEAQGGLTLAADAAWLLTPDSALAWEAGRARLLRLRRTGQETAFQLASTPVCALSATTSGNPAAPLLLTAGGTAGNTPDSPDRVGERVLRLDTELTEVLHLSGGTATALAAGASGTFTVAWVEPGSPPGAYVATFNGTGERLWKASLPGPAQRLALLADGTLVAALGRDILALRQGRLAWRRRMPAPPLGLAPAREGGVLAALPERLLGLRADGTTDWELAPRSRVQGLRVDLEESRAALIETDGVEVVGLPTPPGRDKP